MRPAVRFAARFLRGRPVLRLAGWSVLEAVPAFGCGLAVARAVDDGFLEDRPAVGVAWLATLVVAATVGALGSRRVFEATGAVVESLRDELVRGIVAGALRQRAGSRDDGASVARLTRQVEMARDTYAGIVSTMRGFATTSIATMIGAVSVAPVAAWLIVPPSVLGALLFVASLGIAATRCRAAVMAEERLGAVTGSVVGGIRDTVATGAEDHALALVADEIDAVARAERALAGPAMLRLACFLIGGWGPLILLLGAAPWLVGRGLTAGELLGALTYVLMGLQPALNQLMSGLGTGGLRFVVTVQRLLAASQVPSIPMPRTDAPDGYTISLRSVSFAYGQRAEPIVREFDLDIPEGDHLAVIGPSGAGKSTLVSILCGLIRPQAGSALLGGAVAADLTAEQLADARVLIPQEAFVFSGTVGENLTYLRPDAGSDEVAAAARAVGSDAVVDRLGGLSAPVSPARLSAGERQLLALTRAYLSSAPVVVLDEATCHLDPAAERRAEEAFRARGTTLIVVAHRISSALRAQRVLVLDGERTDVGDHDALTSSCALYRALTGPWTATQPSATARTPGAGSPAFDHSGHPYGYGE